jgi:hypothetical protein
MPSPSACRRSAVHRSSVPSFCADLGRNRALDRNGRHPQPGRDVRRRLRRTFAAVGADEDSDYDIAAFLRDYAPGISTELCRLADLSTAILADGGAFIHTMPYPAGSCRRVEPIMNCARSGRRNKGGGPRSRGARNGRLFSH